MRETLLGKLLLLLARATPGQLAAVYAFLTGQALSGLQPGAVEPFSNLGETNTDLAASARAAISEPDPVWVFLGGIIEEMGGALGRLLSVAPVSLGTRR